MKARTPLVLLTLITAGLTPAAQQQDGQQAPFRFRTGVELINVTATVTDSRGRFVSGLTKEDFRVFEDGEEQPVTHFDNQRVPVSLGIALDTSGSMEGEKMVAARDALNRFLLDLLGPDDEVFLYRFDTVPQLVHGWTTDRRRVGSELRRIRPRGGTAIYDTLAEAIPLAQSGAHRKKALVIISDGNDTSSETGAAEIKRLIRETEVLVYAVGIDGDSEVTTTRSRPRVIFPPRRPGPIPFPFPTPGRRPPTVPPRPPGTPGGGPVYRGSGGADRVNVMLLRDITDDSGGRTEIIRGPGDLDPATAGIADELSKQYYLGYPSTGKNDNRWHSIRVDVRGERYVVRARRGYIATPEP